MNATSTDAVEPMTAEEAAALQTHNSKKSSRDMVFGAILELADCETPAKAPDIARATGLAMPIVYNAIKTLKQRGRIYSDNGMFFIAEEHKDTEPVYHSALPNGVIKLEKGDQILELNQREARALAKTMGGLIEQANVIVMAHKQDEQQAQIRRLQRELSDVLDRLSRVAPPPQMVLRTGAMPRLRATSSESRMAKATPSSIASVMAGRVVSIVMPKNAARAPASLCGLRSPIR